MNPFFDLSTIREGKFVGQKSLPSMNAYLASLVKKRTGSSSPVHYIPYDQAYEPGFEDMARRVPSLDKLDPAYRLSPRDTPSGDY